MLVLHFLRPVSVRAEQQRDREEHDQEAGCHPPRDAPLPAAHAQARVAMEIEDVNELISDGMARRRGISTSRIFVRCTRERIRLS